MAWADQMERDHARYVSDVFACVTVLAGDHAQPPRLRAGREHHFQARHIRVRPNWERTPTRIQERRSSRGEKIALNIGWER